jgi:hypothetical protein
MVLSKMPLHRRPRRASTPGDGLLLRLRPGAASSRVPFRPCRFSRLRRLSPRVRCRFVAPCCRSWGSPGFRLRRPLAPDVTRPKPRSTGEVRAVSIPGDQEVAGMTASRRGMPDESGPMGDEPGRSSEEDPSGSAWSRRTSDRPGPERPGRCRCPCGLRVCGVAAAARIRPGATRLHLICCLLRHSHRRHALRSFSLTHSLVRFQVSRSDAPSSFFRPRGFAPCVNPSPPPV